MEIVRNCFFLYFEIEDDVKNHLSNPNCNENVLLFQLLISMMSYIFIHWQVMYLTRLSLPYFSSQMEEYLKFIFIKRPNSLLITCLLMNVRHFLCNITMNVYKYGPIISLVVKTSTNYSVESRNWSWQHLRTYFKVSPPWDPLCPKQHHNFGPHIH